MDHLLLYITCLISLLSGNKYQILAHVFIEMMAKNEIYIFVQQFNITSECISNDSENCICRFTLL